MIDPVRIPRRPTRWPHIYAKFHALAREKRPWAFSEDLDRSKTWIVKVTKGEHLTAGLIGDRPALKLVAISCTCQEEALAMREAFGDGKLAS